MTTTLRSAVILTLLLAGSAGAEGTETSPPPPPAAPALASIGGTVRYAGSAPLRLKTFSNDVDIDACGHRVSSVAVRAGRKGALADVFVEVRTPDGDPVMTSPFAPSEQPIPIDLTACAFEPPLLILPLGSRVELRNVDGILHELTGLSLRNEPVHARLPRFRRRLLLGPEHFRKAERLKVTCERHSWAGGWWVVTGNGLHALTDTDGRYSIGEVPPGTYLVTAWHGEFEPMESEVVVQAGEALDLDFELR